MPLHHHLWIGCAAAALAVLVAGPTRADVCKWIRSVQDTPAPGATCQTYTTTQGDAGIACRWAFGFRDPVATEFADKLWSGLSMCTGNDPVATDAPVNHPDSYGLRTMHTPDGTVSVSVKDKGGLTKTFVFLRHEPPSTD